jgi:hypothetical protein
MLAGAGAAIVSPALAQQVPDSTFQALVARPAFAPGSFRVRLDEAHHNFHTLADRYRPFAQLLAADGCRLEAGREAFSAASLAGVDLLVIANAAGDDLAGGSDSTVARSAFAPAEIAALHAWVQAGGRLLLIADHAPFGAAAAALAARLGVDMAQGYTFDEAQAQANQGSASIIAFTREAGSLGEHPIMAGRDATERIERVVTFTGQSLLGPPGATPLLRLSAEALDLPPSALALRDDPDAMMRAARPAAGRSLGSAFALGRGRVAVLGEAGMLTAQLILAEGRELRRVGMNVPGLDNRQFVLNLVHWLAGLLPENAAPAAPAATPAPAAPAAVQDFSGLWLIDTQETEAWRGRGAIGNHEEPVRIEQTASALAIEVQSADPAGRFSYDLTGARRQQVDPAAGELWSESSWDGATLVTRGRRLFTTPKGPQAFEFREERSLLADGARMRVTTRIEMRPSDLVRVTEYRRAP